MHNINEVGKFTHREFIDMVRSELVALGRSDVTIERTWIDTDEPGHPFLLRVPVGTELTVPLKAMESFFDAQTPEERKWQAVEFATALVNLKAAESMLAKYARDIRRAANAAVAAARADGLDILLDRVGFKSTYANHLTQKSWKDAAFHILAVVTIRHTSFYHRPETSEIIVEEPADLSKELEDILDDQRERQQRISELDRKTCDLVVDGVTLELLEAHGLDPTATLEQVWKKQCVNLVVEHQGADVNFSLGSCDGYVTAAITLPEAVWNGRYLWLLHEERDTDYRILVNKSLGDIVPHPVFTRRPIVAVTHDHGGQILFDLTDKFLFDGDTGRIRPEERLAA